MNKVICDICGTSYPDTATSCPICGFERDQKLSVLDEDVLVEQELAEEAPVAVKGGRFSHSNVRKRSSGAEPEAESSYEEAYDDGYEEAPEKQPKKESNIALIVVLVLLLAAIVAVIVYIYTSFFAPQGDENPQGTTTEPQTSTSQNESTPPAEIPCTNLTVSETVITLDAIGNAWLLNVVPEPANTTDKVTYASSDEAVATVNESGRITAVGAGTATVTVTCGDKVVTCNVTCTVGGSETTAPGTEPTTEPTTAPTTAPTTEPTTAPTTEPTEPARSWKLNRTEITFSDKYPTPWMLYEGTISKANVTFSSDDESVATFINGVVTPVGNGKTVVRATYNGETLTCTVWVNFKTTATEPSDPTDPSSSATSESTTAATTDGTTAATTEATTAATTEATTAATTEATTAATTEATTAATTEATTAATTEATTSTTEGVG